jgi:CRP-like cAMP-binding protein
MAIQTLISHFNSYLSLTNEEIEAVSKNAKTRQIKRRQFVLQENDLCKHFNFIVDGCLKMYSVDDNNKEHNIQFGSENNWLTDIGSFHSGKPSKMFIEAIEPTIIIQIEQKDMVYLFDHFPKFDRIFRVIVENNFVELQNRLLQTISSTAEERYISFINQYPNLFTRLPNTQIASYLGITPEFLSIVRKNIAAK